MKTLLALLMSTTMASANTVEIISTGTKTWFLNPNGSYVYHTTPYTMDLKFDSDLWVNQPIPGCPDCGPEAHYIRGGLLSVSITLDGFGSWSDPFAGGGWLTWNDTTGVAYAGTDFNDFYLDTPSGQFQIFRCPSSSLPCGLGPDTYATDIHTTMIVSVPSPSAGSLRPLLRLLQNFQQTP